MGTVLQLYINDEFFDRPTPENAFLSLYQPKLNILYEDEHILLLDKRPGLVVHPDEHERVNTLHHPHPGLPLSEEGVVPLPGETPLPPPCATASTGTPAASSSPPKRRRDSAGDEPEDPGPGAEQILPVRSPRNACRAPPGRLEGYLLKDEAKKQVTVDAAVPGRGPRRPSPYTRPWPSGTASPWWSASCITGRTHQIRAQFAAAGHPLLGDGKYGSERENKRYGRSYQALYSYRLEFCFTTDAGALAPLDGQQFQVEQVDFVTEYFPGFSL